MADAPARKNAFVLGKGGAGVLPSLLSDRGHFVLKTIVMLSVAIGMVGAFPAASRAASAAPGQPSAQAAERDDEIVVTGSRNGRAAVAAFVEAVTVETDDQIARFATPLCPASFGLPPEQNEAIEARLRAIAAYLGVGAAGGGCRPNVVVIVAEQGGDFVHRLRRERPELFNALALADIRAIMRQTGPVRAWQTVEPRGADGRPMRRISFVPSPGGPPRYVPNGYELTGVVPSLTSRSTRQDLSLSFVVFDLDAIEGLTLLQIADHAAMRALARTGAIGLPARRSILTLFSDRNAGGPPAEEMTNWDAAYLHALYRTANIVAAAQQRSNISRTMTRELELASDGRQPR